MPPRVPTAAPLARGGRGVPMYECHSARLAKCVFRPGSVRVSSVRRQMAEGQVFGGVSRHRAGGDRTGRVCVPGGDPPAAWCNSGGPHGNCRARPLGGSLWGAHAGEAPPGWLRAGADIEPAEPFHAGRMTSVSSPVARNPTLNHPSRTSPCARRRQTRVGRRRHRSFS